MLNKEKLFSGVYGVMVFLRLIIVCMDEIITTFVMCYKYYNYARFNKRTLRLVRRQEAHIGRKKAHGAMIQVWYWLHWML